MAVAFRALALPASAKGAVHLHSLPGLREPWADFVAAVEAARLDGIVCLVPDQELAVKSPAYAAALNADLALRVDRLPIADFSLPSDRDGFLAAVREVAARIETGARLLVHCRAGVGRTGLFATCLLLALGEPLDAALAAVRDAGSAPETPAQRQFAVDAASAL